MRVRSVVAGFEKNKKSHTYKQNWGTKNNNKQKRTSADEHLLSHSAAAHAEQTTRERDLDQPAPRRQFRRSTWEDAERSTMHTPDHIAIPPTTLNPSKTQNHPSRAEPQVIHAFLYKWRLIACGQALGPANSCHMRRKYRHVRRYTK